MILKNFIFGHFWRFSLLTPLSCRWRHYVTSCDVIKITDDLGLTFSTHHKSFILIDVTHVRQERLKNATFYNFQPCFKFTLPPLWAIFQFFESWPTKSERWAMDSIALERYNPQLPFKRIMRVLKALLVKLLAVKCGWLDHDFAILGIFSKKWPFLSTYISVNFDNVAIL